MNETECVSIRTSRFSHAHIVCQDLLRGAARLSFIARVEGAHSYRAASASKKDGLAAPPYPSSTARSGETEPPGYSSNPSNGGGSKSTKTKPVVLLSRPLFPLQHNIGSGTGSCVGSTAAVERHILIVRVPGAKNRHSCQSFRCFPSFFPSPDSKSNREW